MPTTNPYHSSAICRCGHPADSHENFEGACYMIDCNCKAPKVDPDYLLTNWEETQKRRKEGVRKYREEQLRNPPEPPEFKIKLRTGFYECPYCKRDTQQSTNDVKINGYASKRFICHTCKSEWYKRMTEDGEFTEVIKIGEPPEIDKRPRTHFFY